MSLTDPFYEPAAVYSGTNIPLRSVTITDTGYVDGGLAIVSALQAAGWTIVDSGPGTAVQTRGGYFFQTASGPGTPRDMTAAECTTPAGPMWRRGGAGSLTFNSYDPYRLTPTCAAGTGSIRWVAAGLTYLDTASAFAGQITIMLIWQVTVSEPVLGTVAFLFTSFAAGFENDDVPILMGAPLDSTSGGYYTLRSATVGGVYVEIKVQIRKVASFGASFSYDAIGTKRIVLTVTGSGGGSYVQPIFPGSYHIHASGRQFLIWPSVPEFTYTTNYSLLVSLIAAPTAHSTAGTCVSVVGVNNGQYTGNTDQVRRQLHWSVALACGHGGAIESTYYRQPGPPSSNYKIATMLVRGTKGRPTVSRAGQPLVQAAYIALPNSPTSATAAEAVIAGKLPDIVMTSGLATVGAAMIHDTRRWQCFGRSTAAPDIGVDMWVLAP